MTTHTYEDFLNRARSSGLLSSFSQADLALAQSNPDAGMSILSYKQDYQNAVSDEARALANLGAERIRSAYGGYTGGVSGAGYYLNESQAAGQSPEEENHYVNQYADEQRNIVSGLEQARSGDYRQTAEELWEAYRKAYLREGQRAYENSLGSAAANTGGVASTAAVAAAQQAQNYYAAQAADKKGELYQQAFENQLAERGQALAELGMYDQLNATDHSQYQAAAEQKRQDEQLQAAQEQQGFENALAKWKSYGYVTADIAETLALPVGTAYSEQAYNAWYQAFQEASSGVYTGQLPRDTVNAPEAEEAGAPAPGAGDAPQNHGQIGMGSTGGDVTAMQTYLIYLGYPCGDKGADGVFGTDTRAAVRAFQAAHGLKVDGICGPKTWYAIFAALGE